MDGRDPFEVLGVSPDAEAEVIRAAYRALARKYHPDSNPGVNTAASNQFMAEINWAFQELEANLAHWRLKAVQRTRSVPKGPSRESGQSPRSDKREAPTTAQRASRTSASRFLMGLVSILIAGTAIGTLLVVIASGGSRDENQVRAPTNDSEELVDESLPAPEATLDLARPTVAAAPAHLEGLGPGDRIVIAKYGVDAPLAYQKVAPTGQMPDPQTPDEVVYYDFSDLSGYGGAPGRGGNAVLSGYVDSGKKPCKNGRVPAPCQAVFWNLRSMRVGDEIEIHIRGQVFRYSVTGNQSFNAVSGPWDQIVASTAQENLTLITTGGEYLAGEYTHRTVITAARM